MEIILYYSHHTSESINGSAGGLMILGYVMSWIQGLLETNSSPSLSKNISEDCQNLL